MNQLPVEETRERVLVAAKRVFAECGPFKARIGDIAAEAGVSVGYIYMYFGSKEKLYRIVQEQDITVLPPERI